MRRKAFQITRADGRSNQQVIIDYVKGGEAGRVYSYEELAAALHEGTDHQYTREEVQNVVGNTYSRLLREQARTLYNVRLIGYRLAPGNYHLTLSRNRDDKAHQQMRRGLLVLQHVRWDEMDANQRAAHEGQLLISGALMQQMDNLRRRQDAVEAAIRKARGDAG